MFDGLSSKHLLGIWKCAMWNADLNAFKCNLNAFHRRSLSVLLQSKHRNAFLKCRLYHLIRWVKEKVASICKT